MFFLQLHVLGVAYRHNCARNNTAWAPSTGHAYICTEMFYGSPRIPAGSKLGYAYPFAPINILFRCDALNPTKPDITNSRLIYWQIIIFQLVRAGFPGLRVFANPGDIYREEDINSPSRINVNNKLILRVGFGKVGKTIGKSGRFKNNSSS